MRLRFSVVVLVGLATVTATLAGCGGAVEEEKAGVEEVVEEETRDIQKEGCPEGQTSNAAGTECVDEAEAKEKHALPEEVERREAQRLIRAYERGEGNSAGRLECQMAKAFLDLGQEEFDRMVKDFGSRTGEAIAAGKTPPQNLEEFLADQGYACEPPTAAELDEKNEKVSENPAVLEKQCSPQSNASPAFREANC